MEATKKKKRKTLLFRSGVQLVLSVSYFLATDAQKSRLSGACGSCGEISAHSPARARRGGKEPARATSRPKKACDYEKDAANTCTHASRREKESRARARSHSTEATWRASSPENARARPSKSRSEPDRDSHQATQHTRARAHRGRESAWLPIHLGAPSPQRIGRRSARPRPDWPVLFTSCVAGSAAGRGDPGAQR